MRLHEAVEDATKLVCADNQDKPIKCPNGFCQLISTDSNTFTRTCEPNSSIAMPHGILLESRSLSERDIQSTLTYKCNKNMCNSVAMAKEVRSLLEARNILPFTTTTTTTTTTVKPTVAVTTTSSTGNTLKSSYIIQYALILLMVPICVNFKFIF